MSTTNPDHHVYVLMGVSGSGKSAVASEVAHQIHAAFLDGDFLHPRSNINKMASGAVSYTHLTLPTILRV